MGMMINRRRYMGGNARIPYIMDGCIGFWDAEWNEDFEVHNPNATTWNDLSSAGKDLSMRQGDGYFTWESNRLRCLGKGYIASLAKVYNQFQTIECVFAIDNIITDGSSRMQMPVSAQQTKGVMATSYLAGNAVYVQFGDYNQLSRIMINDSYENFNGKIVSVSAVFTSSSSKIVSRGYYNNVAKEIVSGNAQASSSFFTIGGQSNDGRPVTGYIYTIRLYDRELSSEEISHNWLIDKRRFNIA